MKERYSTQDEDQLEAEIVIVEVEGDVSWEVIQDEAEEAENQQTEGEEGRLVEENEMSTILGEGEEEDKLVEDELTKEEQDWILMGEEEQDEGEPEGLNYWEEGLKVEDLFQ